MMMKYQVNDPFFESFFITDKKQLKTSDDLKNIFASYFQINKSQFTIVNIPKKINTITEEFIFKLTITNRCKDITFHFARGKEIIIYNCYQMKRDEVISQFQKSGIYYSYEISNKNLQFLISNQNVPNIKYPFFAVHENSIVEVKLNGKTVTLKYDQKEFTVVEEDKANKAYQIIFSAYNHFIKIENICIIRNGNDRKKIEGNYLLKSDENYSIEIYHRFNFKNIKIKGRLMNEKLNFLATVYDAKKQLAKVLSNGCDVLQPEDIIICDYMKKEIKDEKKLLRDIDSFHVYINYVILKDSFHPIEKDVKNSNWSLSRTMNKEKNERKRKQLTKNEVKSEEYVYLEEEETETESYRESEENKIIRNGIKIENHIDNHLTVNKMQRDVKDTNIQIEKKSKILIDSLKEEENDKSEKKTHKIGDITKPKEMDDLEGNNNNKNETKKCQGSNKGRIRQNKKKPKKLKNKIKPKKVDLKGGNEKQKETENNKEQNTNKKSDEKTEKQKDKTNPKEVNNLKISKKKTEVNKQDPKQNINKKEKPRKRNKKTKKKTKNNEQKQEQKITKLEFKETENRNDENKTIKSKSDKNVKETTKKKKNTIVITKAKQDDNKYLSNSKEVPKSNKEKVKNTKSKRNKKINVSKKQNKPNDESDRKVEPCENDKKIPQEPKCDVKNDNFIEEQERKLNKSLNIKKAKRKPNKSDKSNDKDDKTIKITFLFEENNVKQNEPFTLNIFPNETIKELKKLVSNKLKIESNILLSHKKEKNYIIIDDNAHIKDIIDKIGCKTKQTQITNYLYIRIIEPTVSTVIEIDTIKSTKESKRMNDEVEDYEIVSVTSTNEIEKKNDVRNCLIKSSNKTNKMNDDVAYSVTSTNEIEKKNDTRKCLLKSTNETNKMNDGAIYSVTSTNEINKIGYDDEINLMKSTNEINKMNSDVMYSETSTKDIERNNKYVDNNEIIYNEIEKKSDDDEDEIDSEVRSTSENKKMNDDDDNEIISFKSTNDIDRTNVEKQDNEIKSINETVTEENEITAEMIPILFKFEQHETLCHSFIRPIHINTHVKMLEEMISNEFGINDNISLYYKNENNYFMDIDKNARVEDIIDQIIYKDRRGKFNHCIFVQITKKSNHKKDKRKDKRKVDNEERKIPEEGQENEKIRIDFSFENNVKYYEPFSESISVKTRIKDLEKLIRNKYDIGVQVSILYKENGMFIDINKNTRIEEILNSIKRVYKYGIVRFKLYIKVLKTKRIKFDANVDNDDSIQKIKQSINIYSHLYKLMNDDYDEDED